MEHQTGTLVLLFICLALLIGTAVRHLLKRSAIPYTVALLLIGLCVGLADRHSVFTNQWSLLNHTIALVRDIEPHLILFIFLPTLIFESAFALEVHLFRRTLPQIAVLAVPGLIVATLTTAMVAKYLFPWEWSWPIALMFGALISATDPVAVVALLKEISSRKRLETLLEGESLLNDGTAIVLFVLFYNLVTAETPSTTIAIDTTLLEFIRVIFLGLLTGLVLGWIAIIWIKRVFNDPMIEITLSIVVAYLAFFLAEEGLHASGVVAVVTVAVLFAGRGRSRISPEVGEFLHKFWGMMAFIANTLIFLIVGIVIATRIQLESSEVWVTLALLYIAVLIIRTASITLFAPLLKRIGIGINRQKIIVLSWGGLRGAVALALALTIAQNDAIPQSIGDQILFLCAGIVVLTILINGTTMKSVLHWLGLDKLPIAKQATLDKASLAIRHAIDSELPKLKRADFIRQADWQAIHSSLSERVSTPHLDIEAIEEQASDEELEIAFRRRILEAERKTYWLFVRQGIISSETAAILSESVENALDVYPHLHPRKDVQNQYRAPHYIAWLERIPFLSPIAKLAEKKHVSHVYEIIKGFKHAQTTITAYLKELAPAQNVEETVREEISRNIDETNTIITRLTEQYPDATSNIDTYIAQNIILHRKREQIHHLLESGVLDVPEAERMTTEVEQQMLQLQKLKSRANPL